MEFRGKPVVPPGCPSLVGNAVDIATAPVSLVVHDAKSNGEWVTELFIAVGSSDEGAILTPSLAVPFESQLSEKMNDLRDRYDEHPDAVAEELRTALCDSIRNCSGLRHGICGAMSTVALASLVERLSSEQA